MAVEQKFVRYLLNQIDAEMDEVTEPQRARIKSHLAELEGIADEVFGVEQTSARRGRKGGANA